MNLLDKLTGRLTAPKLTRGRIVLALLVGLSADGLQILLPVPPAPEIIDVIAAVLTFWLLGFHVLLLPTFVVELVPVVDMLPTWSACVVAVIALRKREQGSELPLVVDVESTVQTPPPPRLPSADSPPPAPARD
jgi:hypothetical protein